MTSPIYKTSLLKFAIFVFAIFIICSIYGQQVIPQPAAYQQIRNSSALLFMENRGQVADEKGNVQSDILFTANSGGATIYLTGNSIHYQFSKIEYPTGYDPRSKDPVKEVEQQEALRKQAKISTHRFTIELPGANLYSTITKEKQSSYFENYYLPQCANGITGVHGYEKITIHNIYPDIDWVVYSKGGFMEYDFLVHPGGNPANIQLKVKDANQFSITPRGELLITTSLGEVKEKAPISYADGKLIASRFKQNIDGTIGFEVQPQPGKALRIDPSIVWATYYGGTSYEESRSCAADSNGNIYMTGNVRSPGTGLASGGFQNVNGGGYWDAYLAKFDSSGNRLWATYYGGGGEEFGMCCCVDGAGNVYIAGRTNTQTGMASGGFQNASNGYEDALLAKFSSTGGRLWATYYGGDKETRGYACAVDKNNNVYLAGYTNCDNNIAFNGFQNTFIGSSVSYISDAFLVKFSSSGSRLWATYYGGESFDYGMGCTTDSTGNIYLSGYTKSVSGIASGGFQNTYGGGAYDAFLVKFNGNGNRIWATYYGGNAEDRGYAVTADREGNVYIAGHTVSETAIAFNGFQNTYGGNNDAFLVKFSNNGNRLWSTYYGGCFSEEAYGCTTDKNNNVFITGYTVSTGIASAGFQNKYGGLIDAFLAKYTSAGNRLWSSYFGDSTEERGYSCASDNFGNIYFCGLTGVDGYTFFNSNISVNGFQNMPGGSLDAFLAKITDKENTVCVPPDLPVVGSSGSFCRIGMPAKFCINAGSLNSAAQWEWYSDSCNGTLIGTGTSISVTPATTTAAYYVRGVGNCVTAGNCTKVMMQLNETPVANFYINPNFNTPIQFTQATFNFINTSRNATRYQWRFGDASISSIQNPTHMYQSVGNYYVSLYASNNAGCIDTLTLGPLQVVADSAWHIPNAFSPNGDGVNDTWVINGLQGNINCKLSIFNRWGQLLISSKGYTPWDGTYKGKPLAVGTYYYIINVDNRTYNGSVTLLR